MNKTARVSKAITSGTRKLCRSPPGPRTRRFLPPAAGPLRPAKGHAASHRATENTRFLSGSHTARHGSRTVCSGTFLPEERAGTRPWPWCCPLLPPTGTLMRWARPRGPACRDTGGKSLPLTWTASPHPRGECTVAVLSLPNPRQTQACASEGRIVTRQLDSCFFPQLRVKRQAPARPAPSPTLWKSPDSWNPQLDLVARGPSAPCHRHRFRVQPDHGWSWLSRAHRLDVADMGCVCPSPGPSVVLTPVPFRSVPKIQGHRDSHVKMSPEDRLLEGLSWWPVPRG